LNPLGWITSLYLTAERERRDECAVIAFSSVFFKQFVEHVIEYKHAAGNFKGKFHAEILLVIIDEVHHIKVIHTP
jgi:hypothetical protein